MSNVNHHRPHEITCVNVGNGAIHLAWSKALLTLALLDCRHLVIRNNLVENSRTSIYTHHQMMLSHLKDIVVFACRGVRLAGDAGDMSPALFMMNNFVPTTFKNVSQFIIKEGKNVGGR